METNYKITIPQPCHEDWNKMTPDETGRFCNSCVKSVVDFTNMKAPEIQEYFIKNSGKNVCGRFKTAQLDSIIIRIPKDVLFSQVQFHKIFMLALLVSMGTTLLSCQNSNGDKQKIDSVEVVDTLNRIPGTDSLKINTTVPDFKSDSLSSTGPYSVLTGFTVTEPIIDSTAATVKIAEPVNILVEEDDFIYGMAGINVTPEYRGGIQKFYDFFMREYKLPRKAKKVSGELNISFIVEKDGSLSGFKVINDLGYGTGEEAIRVLQLSDKWYPGEQNGKKNRTLFHLPITIAKDGSSSSKLTSISLIPDSIITTDN
jgi:hypothetical protein